MWSHPTPSPATSCARFVPARPDRPSSDFLFSDFASQRRRLASLLAARHAGFKESLELVAPDIRFDPFELFLDEQSPLYETMNKLLPALNTGISHLEGDELPFTSIPIPDDVREKILKELPDGGTIRIRLEPLNERYSVVRRVSELKAHKLVTFHTKKGGGDMKFDMASESDGLQRVIDILPVFLGASATQLGKFSDRLKRLLRTLLGDAVARKCTPVP